MICGPYGRVANRDNLVAGHGRFLLTRADASTLFDDVVATVRSRWREAMRRAGVGRQDRDRIAGAFVYDGLMRRDPA